GTNRVHAVRERSTRSAAAGKRGTEPLEFRLNNLVGLRVIARDRQCNVFLRFKLGGANGLGIQVKRGGHLGVARQSLNRLYILAPADQKSREGMTKIMESESLTRFQSNADLEGGGANLVCCHDA